MTEGPLTGVTVIDLTRVLAGPYCTMMLADMGARVIKVERPGVGDDARGYGPFAPGGSVYFASVNRGKESIELDIVEERRLFEQLLDRADLLVENFRPGALERLGYSWSVLEQRWPRLILVSVSGFGQSGPWSRRPAYDMIAQAMGGIMSITGDAGGAPTRVGASIGDISAGMFAAFGAVTALHQRARTGKGAWVDVAMLDSQIAMLENAIGRYTTSAEVPGPIGSRHPSITPFGVFATSDGPVVIAAGNDALFTRLCDAIGRAELAEDSRFRTNDDRTRNEASLKAAIEAALGSADRKTWIGRFEARGIPASPVHNVAEALAHPQVIARGMALPFDCAGFDGVLAAGNPVRLSTHDGRRSTPPPPRLGEHRQRILDELEQPDRGLALDGPP